MCDFEQKCVKVLKNWMLIIGTHFFENGKRAHDQENKHYQTGGNQLASVRIYPGGTRRHVWIYRGRDKRNRRQW